MTHLERYTKHTPDYVNDLMSSMSLSDTNDIIDIRTKFQCEHSNDVPRGYTPPIKITKSNDAPKYNHGWMMVGVDWLIRYDHWLYPVVVAAKLRGDLRPVHETDVDVFARI